MLEELSILINLQRIDTQLLELDSEKGDLPDQLEKLDNEISIHNETIAEAEQQLREITTQKKEKYFQIDEARERLKKSQSMIFSVKTTREYDAISSEIEHAKNQIAESERQLIEMLVREEEMQAVSKDERTKLEKTTNDYNERKVEMRERFDINQEEENQLQLERQKIAEQLKKPVYGHYERVRKIRDGVGVSHIVDSACSYCSSRIPPQRQTEIKRMKDLILCEVCGCIIVDELLANNHSNTM